MAPGGLHDQHRLAVLRDLAILDTPAEPAYDDLARIAAVCCRAPVAAVNFVDDVRHWSKATVGVEGGPGGSVPASLSFCAATVSTQAGLLVIPDTTVSDAWQAHPIVTGSPAVRFYAGAAIVVHGEPIGVVCAYGDQPRDISEAEQGALIALAGQAASQLELRDRTTERLHLIAELSAVSDRNLALAARFEGVFEHAPSGMALIDPDRLVTRANAALGQVFGRSPEALVGYSLQAMIDPADLEGDLARFAALQRGEVDRYQHELRLIDARGRSFWAGSWWSAVRDGSGKVVHYIAQFKDISERKQLEARLRRLADQDSLTGVRSRRLFEEDVVTQVQRCRRYGEKAALLLIDLNDFKQINDGHGHQAGDRMLRAIAETLSTGLRASDRVARFGGDEFAVLLPHINAEELESVLANLRESIAGTTIDVAGGLSVTAAIGVAHLDKHVRDADAVLAQADRAMYRDKHALKEDLTSASPVPPRRTGH